MSEKIISAMDFHQEVHKSLSKTKTEIRDLFAVYLGLINENLAGSEEVVFHNPEHPLIECGQMYHASQYPYKNKTSGNCSHCVRLVKDKVVREDRGYRYNSVSLMEYLVKLGGVEQMSIGSARVAMNDIRRCPVDRRVTTEMLTEKYDEYKRLQKDERGRERLLKRVFGMS